MPAPAYFFFPGALDASWSCNDPESGVTFVDFRALKNGVDIFTLPANYAGETGEASLRGSPPGTFAACVVAYNGAGAASVEYCSDTTTYDETPPLIAGVFQGDGALFIAPSIARPLCVSWAGVADEDSGISSMSATLYRADGDDEVAVWPAVELSPSEAGEWCASGADSAALETGAVYLWEITAKNGANLTKTEESAAAIVDRTPPTAGEATLRVVYPIRLRLAGRLPGFGDPGVKFRARIDDFDDDESGVGSWNFTVRDMDGNVLGTPSGDLLPGELVVDSEEIGGALLNGTWLVLTVAVYNRAGLYVEVEAAPLLVILEEIEFDDVWVVDGAWAPLASPGWLPRGWSAAVGLTPAKLPNKPETTFTHTWALARAPCAAPTSIGARWGRRDGEPAR